MKRALRRGLHVALLAWLAAPAWAADPAGGAGDWLLAVGASYAAVLLGASAGVLAAWWPPLHLARWLLSFGGLLLAVMVAWQPADTTLAAWVLGLTTGVSGAAFGVLRWLARRWRQRLR